MTALRGGRGWPRAQRGPLGGAPSPPPPARGSRRGTAAEPPLKARAAGGDRRSSRLPIARRRGARPRSRPGWGKGTFGAGRGSAGRAPGRVSDSCWAWPPGRRRDFRKKHDGTYG